MPHSETASCPKCGISAYGRKEINEYFGFRFGGFTPQSWCRECRRRDRHEKTCTSFRCPVRGQKDCSQRMECCRPFESKW